MMVTIQSKILKVFVFSYLIKNFDFPTICCFNIPFTRNNYLISTQANKFNYSIVHIVNLELGLSKLTY